MRKEYRLILESEDLISFFKAYDAVAYAVEDAFDEYGNKVIMEFEEIDE